MFCCLQALHLPLRLLGTSFLSQCSPCSPLLGFFVSSKISPLRRLSYGLSWSGGSSRLSFVLLLALTTSPLPPGAWHPGSIHSWFPGLPLRAGTEWSSMKAYWEIDDLGWNIWTLPIYVLNNKTVFIEGRLCRRHSSGCHVHGYDLSKTVPALTEHWSSGRDSHYI